MDKKNKICENFVTYLYNYSQSKKRKKKEHLKRLSTEPHHLTELKVRWERRWEKKEMGKKNLRKPFSEQ